MILHINAFQLTQIIGAQLDLNTFYLLEQYINGLTVTLEGARMKGWQKNLVLKGFITEDNTVTQLGREFYLDVLNNKYAAETVKQKTEKAKESFDQWWDIFPGTDAFEHRGKKFLPTRGLKKNKSKCKDKFNKLVHEGEYTAEQIIEATKMDINTRKEHSVKINENKLTFLNNSETYLNQRSFEGYVDLIKEKPQESGNSNNRFLQI